jgi:formylmethanofuran dehydrogenase subunit E
MNKGGVKLIKEISVFICEYCKKPKKFKSMSSKTMNGKPVCKSCNKKVGHVLFY